MAYQIGQIFNNLKETKSFNYRKNTKYYLY